MFSESNRAIDCNRTVALVAAPLLPLHLTGVASDFEFVLFYLVVPAVVLAIAIYFRDQFGAGPKEMTYRIHWDSAFFGMGVAFMVARAVCFLPSWGSPALATVCFLIGIVIRGFGGQTPNRQTFNG